MRRRHLFFLTEDYVHALKLLLDSPDRGTVNLATWMFVRGAECIEVTQRALAEGPELVVAHNGTARSYGFDSVSRLARFQTDMETFLLNTGWQFRQFSPERRRGRDRRGFPRVAERRRWWTDGTVEAKKVVWGG